MKVLASSEEENGCCGCLFLIVIAFALLGGWPIIGLALRVGWVVIVVGFVLLVIIAMIGGAFKSIFSSESEPSSSSFGNRAQDSSKKSSDEAQWRAEQERQWREKQSREPKEKQRNNQRQSEDKYRQRSASSNVNNREQALTILGLSNLVSKVDIKSAYRKLAMRYHPDKLENFGEEFKSLAESKMKEINMAYDFLK